MPSSETFEFDPKVRIADGERQIFDPIRKKWMVLLPEEWVRQYYVAYMSQVLGYPVSRMRCEVQVKGAGRPKRADLIIYNRKGEPAMVCEFKAMDVPVNDETIFQAAKYNRDIKAPFVFVANGKQQTLITLNFINGKHITSLELPSRQALE